MGIVIDYTKQSGLALTDAYGEVVGITLDLLHGEGTIHVALWPSKSDRDGGKPPEVPLNVPMPAALIASLTALCSTEVYAVVKQAPWAAGAKDALQGP